jgi:hypothetical protein
MISLLLITNRGLYPMPEESLGTYDLLAQSLLAQTYLRDGGAFEAIIVDKHNPIPRRELTHFLGDRVRFVRPRPTPWQELELFAPASARNTGLIYAGQGRDPRDVTVVALDDCYTMSPRFLEQVAAHAAADRYVVPRLVGGLDREQRFGAPWHFDTGHHPGGIVAYPLDRALAINGYDERYDGCGAYEDIDFTARLELAGVTWVRDDAVVATLHAPHAQRPAQPKCGLLVWLLNRARRQAGSDGALLGNQPWTSDELCAFETCGRAAQPPCCRYTLQHDPRVGTYGGQCDYGDNLNGDETDEPAAARAVRLGYQTEPPAVRRVRTTYETQPWLSLAAARDHVRLLSGAATGGVER